MLAAGAIVVPASEGEGQQRRCSEGSGTPRSMSNHSRCSHNEEGEQEQEAGIHLRDTGIIPPSELRQIFPRSVQSCGVWVEDGRLQPSAIRTEIAAILKQK